MDGEKHSVRVMQADFITHNVKHFVVKKPAGYFFIPGQATEISIPLPGIEDQRRPFTFTNLPDSDDLEFMIKIYTGHGGLTENLLKVKPGDDLVVHEVFGTIHFAGPGLFLAGGAGITPFVSIFRQLKKEKRLNDNTLLFANRTEADIILRDELREMLHENYHDILSAPVSGNSHRIDRMLIGKYLKSTTPYCYVCGPDQFTTNMIDTLQFMGVPRLQIIYER